MLFRVLNICKLLFTQVAFAENDDVVVLISALGVTPIMELYILYNKVEELSRDKGVKVRCSYVGNYFTSLEMMGVTLTVMKLDDELKELIDVEANSGGKLQPRKEESLRLILWLKLEG